MRETIVKVKCDLCPKTKQTELSEAEVFTLRFQHGGRTLETDLCQQHGKQLVEHATAVVAPLATRTAGGTRSRKPSLVTDPAEKKRMRAWLQEQKVEGVRDRGVISEENQQKWIDAGKPGV